MTTDLFDWMKPLSPPPTPSEPVLKKSYLQQVIEQYGDPGCACGKAADRVLLGKDDRPVCGECWADQFAVGFGDNDWNGVCACGSAEMDGKRCRLGATHQGSGCGIDAPNTFCSNTKPKEQP